MGASRATAWWRSRRRSIRSGRSRAPRETARCCSKRSPAHDRATRPPRASRCRTTRAALTGDMRGVAHRRAAASTSSKACEPGVEAAVRAGDRRAARRSALRSSRYRCRTPSMRCRCYYIIAPAEASREPGALQRRALWAACARARTLMGRDGETRGAGFGPEVQATHHARHLRALGGLLRRLLSSAPSRCAR